MRIGLLTTSFPRYEGDIPGNFVLGFARALVREGHQVDVLAPEPAQVHPHPAEFAPVQLTWVPYLRPRALERTFYGAGVLDNLRRDPLAFLGLVPFSLSLGASARSRVHAWDALVSHWALPCALVAGAVRQHRPHLAVLHSADVSLLERLPARRSLARRIVHGASALVFSSRNLRQRFLALLDPLERAQESGRMHVCAMGVEAGGFAREPNIDASLARPSARESSRRALGLERFTLLSLGRLVPIKGLEHAIEAVCGAAGVELVIAGEGPEREKLQQRARALKAPVRFVGEVRGSAKDAWLNAADAFVVPSLQLPSGRTEGMPTSVLEAMQAGLPVIASRVGGLPDLVEHGVNGFLVSPGRSEEIRSVLQEIMAAPDRLARLGAEARETAEQYEWDKLGPHFSRLLTGEDLP